MMNIQRVKTVIVTILALILCQGCGGEQVRYEPTAESLSAYGDGPEWFRDAKLGIYFHWGVYSVPAFSSEWYPRHMHGTGRVFKHHVETWGEHTEFGYHDFVPMFKAEKFDANEWAELFKKAGARFAGPVAEHHDGFAMWDSEFTPWNAADKGPKKDIVGLMERAVRKNGMRYITTFHHARNNIWYEEGKWQGYYNRVKTRFPALLEDPENAFMYGYMPRDEFIKMWKNKLVEVIDNYQPDMIWFDSCLDQMPEKDRYEFAAYYFNKSNDWGKKVVIIRKENDLPVEFSVNDHEKARESGASERVWMTDDTISTGSWCYTENLKIKSASKVIHALADTVSKNGVVLLNVSPKANGIIPEDQKRVLLELGDWLKTNGEAIYETRPWVTFGEGPTREPSGGFSDRKEFLNLEYSTKDVRYTASKDGKTIFAIVLGKPAPAEEITLSSFAKSGNSCKVKGVSLLGSKEKISFEQDGESLRITCPEYFDVDYAVAFKIEIE